MSRVGRQDSIDSFDSFDLADGGLVEAPTLSSKEIKLAREQALAILKTKSPEEALKIFTQGTQVKVDHLVRQKEAEAPRAADGEPKPSATVQAPPKN